MRSSHNGHERKRKTSSVVMEIKEESSSRRVKEVALWDAAKVLGEQD